MKQLPVPTYRYAAIALAVGALLIVVLSAEERFFAWAIAVGLCAGAVGTAFSVLSLTHGRWLSTMAPVVTVLSYKALVQPDPGMNVMQAGEFLGGFFVGAAVAGAIHTYAVRRRQINPVVDNQREIRAA